MKFSVYICFCSNFLFVDEFYVICSTPNLYMNNLYIKSLMLYCFVLPLRHLSPPTLMQSASHICGNMPRILLRRLLAWCHLRASFPTHRFNSPTPALFVELCFPIISCCLLCTFCCFSWQVGVEHCQCWHFRLYCVCTRLKRKANMLYYIQVWKGQGSRKWKLDQSDGFFVQFESPSLRKIWFVPSKKEKGRTLCR